MNKFFKYTQDHWNHDRNLFPWTMVTWFQSLVDWDNRKYEKSSKNCQKNATFWHISVGAAIMTKLLELWAPIFACKFPRTISILTHMELRLFQHCPKYTKLWWKKYKKNCCCHSFCKKNLRKILFSYSQPDKKMHLAGTFYLAFTVIMTKKNFFGY